MTGRGGQDHAQLFRRMMEAGQEMARTLNPALQAYEPAEMADTIPTLPPQAVEAMFGTTFNPGGLDARTRLLLILAALVVQGAVAEPQIRLTIRHARQAGASDREIGEAIAQMAAFGGVPAMARAIAIAREVAEEERAGNDRTGEERE